MKTFYHATYYDNMGYIIRGGLKPGTDGLIYLTDSPEAAIKFACFMDRTKQIVTVNVHIPNAELAKVEESHDHDESFFKCKAYAYESAIPAKWLGAWKYICWDGNKKPIE